MPSVTPSVIDASLPKDWKPVGKVDAASVAEAKEKLLDPKTTYGKWFEQIRKRSGFTGPKEYLAEEILRNQSEYDTIGAMQKGVEPQPYKYDTVDGEAQYHWASKTQAGDWLKNPATHPTAWMEVFMSMTGKDPAQLGIKTKEDADTYLSRNGRGMAR